MTTGRRSTDWLTGPSAPEANGEERSGQDRRANDRRAPRRKLDPLFAATLVNQLLPQSGQAQMRYMPPPVKVRCGLLVNFRA